MFLREKDDAIKATTAIPTRDAVKSEDTWDLAPVFATPADWQAALEKLAADFPKIAEWKGRLGESPAVLRDVLEFEKTLDLTCENLRVYASLKLSEDSSDAQNLARTTPLDSPTTIQVPPQTPTDVTTDSAATDTTHNATTDIATPPLDTTASLPGFPFLLTPVKNLSGIYDLGPLNALLKAAGQPQVSS